jgi:transposase InsO family protein
MGHDRSTTFERRNVMDKLKPKDHAEAVALFRSEIIGQLTRRDLDRGELQHELRRLSKKRFRPPGSNRTRLYGVSTLERWYYGYKRGGLEALQPRRRSDRGRAQRLTLDQRQLLLDIRREHRSASVPLILRTMVAEGRLEQGAVSPATVRRLYVDEGLDRIPLRDGNSPRTRLRWQAERPRALWHADVCHGPPIVVDDNKKPVRIHAIMDDASRYVVALQAMHNERELDMLHIFVRALRRHGGPDALYLDNGSTYRGDVLRLGCERLGITLLHAAPYDPEARGKMERLWRTLRGQCLRYLGERGSLHDVNVRLWAWLDMHYHRAPHAGLFGRTPAAVWGEAEADPEVDHLDEKTIRQALTVHERRRVRRDNTLSVAGLTFQLDQGFLAGRVVTVAYCMLDEPPEPVVVANDKQYCLHPVDPVHNAKIKRPPRREDTSGAPGPKPTGFNPPDTLLQQMTGRLPKKEG